MTTYACLHVLVARLLVDRQRLLKAASPARARAGSSRRLPSPCARRAGQAASRSVEAAESKPMHKLRLRGSHGRCYSRGHGQLAFLRFRVRATPRATRSSARGASGATVASLFQLHQRAAGMLHLMVSSPSSAVRAARAASGSGSCAAKPAVLPAAWRDLGPPAAGPIVAPSTTGGSWS